MRRTKILILLALSLSLIITAPIAEADSPDNEIKYYRMVEFEGNNSLGEIKILAPQSDMSYPKNCTLYMVVAVFSDHQAEILLNNDTIATVPAQGLKMITFVTPAGTKNSASLTFRLGGETALVVSYGLTSVHFDIFSEVNMPQIEDLNEEWQNRYEQWDLTPDDTVMVDEDLIAALRSAQTPILISAIMAAVGIALAFALKWASRLIHPRSTASTWPSWSQWPA